MAITGLSAVTCLLLSAALIGALVAPTDNTPSGPAVVSRTPSPARTVAARLPVSLSQAVAKALGDKDGLPGSIGTSTTAVDRSLQQLTAHYGPRSISMVGAGFQFRLSLGSMGRGGSMKSVDSSLEQQPSGVTYQSHQMSESFKPVSAGIEQSFQIQSRPAGSGPLAIEVPVSDLTVTSRPTCSPAADTYQSQVKAARLAGFPAAIRAMLEDPSHLSCVSASASIVLRNSKGTAEATYSNLKVLDASGAVVPANMTASASKRAVLIEVQDSAARYPLTVDPVWSQSAEVTSSDGGPNDNFGFSVAVSGSLAVVGAWQHQVGANEDEGAAYVFASNGGGWTQTAELTTSDGATDDWVGYSVAISGAMVVVGAPFHGSGGAAYVFTDRAGTWSQTAEVDNPAGQSDWYGSSVAISGSTMAVGAYEQNVGSYNSAGAVYLYSLSGGTWVQSADFTGPGTGDALGHSVALSGATLVAGAPDGATQFADVFTSTNGTWSLSKTLEPSDGQSSDCFGWSAAVSGTTAVIGDPCHTVGGNSNSGAAYVFGASNWAQTAEVTASDEGSGDQFGISVGISGATAIVGAWEHTVNGNSQQGSAYLFTVGGSSAAQLAELTASDGAAGDGLGIFVAISGTTTVAGALYHQSDGNYGQGAAYFFSGSEFQPQGSAVGNDSVGGGSPSEPCACGGNVTSIGPDTVPIDPDTGDVNFSATDLSLPGAGLPLVFTRTYSSELAVAQASANQTAPLLGYGWSTNLGMTLAYNSQTQVATINEETGAQITFTPYSSGTSPAWCTSATNFCASAPRQEATLNHNANGTWSFARDMGQSETFNFSSTGTLTSITDPAGDALTEAAYSPGTGQTACPSGDSCTAWTNNRSGRVLVLGINSSGQLTEAFDANSTLAATFTYSSGTECTFSGHPADLCEATDPGGISFTYTYHTEQPFPDDYTIFGVTPPGTQPATIPLISIYYEYGGQANEEVNIDNGHETLLSYSGSNGTEAGGSTSVTTYPMGTGNGEPQDVTVDDYSSNVLVAQEYGAGTGSAGTTTYGRDPASMLPMSTQDPDGNVGFASYQTYNGTGGTPVSSGNQVSSTTGTGDVAASAFNSLNQAWCTVDASDYDNGVVCPSTPPSAPPAPGASDPNLGADISFYNSADQLTATTNALGDTTTYSYTSGVSGVPNNLQYCSVDPSDYQKNVVCPAYGAAHTAGTTTATYDAAGDKVTSTDADGDTTSYVYNAPGHPGSVSSETDPDGTTTSYTYNGAGQVTEQVASFRSYAATTLYAYDPYGRKYCEVDPYEAAKAVTCPSTPPNPPTVGNDAYLGATITNYDSDGRVTQTTNPLGGITLTAYDQAGETYCSVDPYNAAKNVTCPSSPPSSPPTIGNDPYAGAVITTYDPDGRVIQQTNAAGGITTTTYDAAGNVAETVVETNASDVQNVATAYTYDFDNRQVSKTVGYGSATPSTTLTGYDPNGNAYCTVSANAYAAGPSAYQCPAWQPAWITSPPSPTSLYSTTPNAVQANNVTTAFFNADAHQVQSTNPDVQTSISAVNADGNEYCSADPTNVAAYLTAHPSAAYPYLCPTTPPTSPPAQGSNPGYVTTIYDSAQRALTSTDQVGDTTTKTYDPTGQVLTTTDPRGEVTTNCYYYENTTGQCAAAAPGSAGSGDDLYSATNPATAADPSGEVTTYTYYPGGQADTTTTPAGTATDTYDAMLDLAGTTYSGAAAGYSAAPNVSYTYYPNQARQTMTDGTGTTTYSYDQIGDVSQTALSPTVSGLSPQTVTYAYDADGRLTTLNGETYFYDGQGRISSVAGFEGGGANDVSFSYDPDGNLTGQDNNTSVSMPSGTSQQALAYDAADEAKSVSATLAQGCGGAETQTQSFSGASGSRNPDGQLTEYTNSTTNACGSAPSYQRNYSYDLAGRVVYQGAIAQGANPADFAYDPSGDPTTISSHDPTGSFDTYTQAFDAAGEVTSQTPVSGSGGVTSTYGYDTLGDQTTVSSTAGSTTSSYNQAAQLASLSSSSTTAQYLYNGAGLEAAAIVGVPAWLAATDVDGSNTINGVSCATSSFCVAVDAKGNALTWNGSAWTTTDIDSTNTLESVSCVSSSFCAAVDAKGNGLTYNGSTWAAHAIDGTNTINSVSCPSTTFCAAVDAKGNGLTYNGSTWAAATSIDGTNSITAVSCASSSLCAAVDGRGYATTYNGSTWTTPADIDGANALTAVSCSSGVTDCVAVDNKGNAVTYTGTWSTAYDFDGTNALAGVSCEPGSLDCVAVDNKGNEFTGNNTSWTTAKDIDGTRALKAVSCANATFCVATDASGYQATFATRAAWGTPADKDSNNSIPSVSCASSSFCVAVDAKGNALAYNGLTWTSTDIDGTNALSGISCPAVSDCVAVDAKGNALTYQNSTWTVKDIDGTNPLDAVSCATTTACVAVDNKGNEITYNGSTWTVSDIDGTNSLAAISCPTSSFCVAVDAKGNDAVYSGSWSVHDIDTTNAISGVSCTTSAYCVAVDAKGNALTYNGSTWTSKDIDGANALDAVSCSSTTFCVGVDSKGNSVGYNGSTWTVTDADSNRVTKSVSCLGSAFCTVTDATGYEVLFQPATTTYQMTWDTNGQLPLLLSDGINTYGYGPGNEPVEETSPNSTSAFYLLYSPSESAWLVASSSGTEVGYYGYDAYGNLAFGLPVTNFGYAGQYTDPATGLSYMRARWYEPQDGGFTTRDPAFDQTDMAYGYASGDPVNKSDPTGNIVIGVCGGVAMELGGAFSGDICLVRTVFEPGGRDDIGFTFTAGFGFGTVGADASLGLLVSNADYIQQLGGWFYQVAAGIGAYGASVFWGSTPSNAPSYVPRKTIWGVVVKKGITSPWPTGAFEWTYTRYNIQRSWWIADPLRYAWDAAVGVLGGEGAALGYLGTANAILRFIQLL